MGFYSERWKNKKLPGIPFYKGFLKCTATKKLLYFGDFVSGHTENGDYYEGQINEVGGGTLGIWYNDKPIELHPENGGEVVKTIVLKKRATEKEKEFLYPKNEIHFILT